MVEGQEGVLKFFVAHEKFSESVEPAVTRLNDPATSLFVRGFFLVLGFALSIDDVRNVPMRQDDRVGVLSSVARICTKMFGSTLLGVGSFDHDVIQHGIKLFDVMHVGSGHDEG